MAVKLITGHRAEGKTSYLLQWLWKHRDDRVVMFVPQEMQKKRILKETDEELEVHSLSWGFSSIQSNIYDYSAIDDLWKFNNPKKTIERVGERTREEVRCTMSEGLFDITTLEEIRT